jgi:hypothetical protein
VKVDCHGHACEAPTAGRSRQLELGVWPLQIELDDSLILSSVPPLSWHAHAQLPPCSQPRLQIPCEHAAHADRSSYNFLQKRHYRHSHFLTSQLPCQLRNCVEILSPTPHRCHARQDPRMDQYRYRIRTPSWHCSHLREYKKDSSMTLLMLRPLPLTQCVR